MRRDDEWLRVLLQAWAELPESVKAAVVEMVVGRVSAPVQIPINTPRGCLGLQGMNNPCYASGV